MTQTKDIYSFAKTFNPRLCFSNMIDTMGATNGAGTDDLSRDYCFDGLVLERYG